MSPSAGGLDTRPTTASVARLRHNPVVLRGTLPEAELADGAPATGRLASHYGDYLIRVESIPAELHEMLLRAVGTVGGRAHIDERRSGVVVLAVTSAQLEALRAQLLAAPAALLRMAEETAMTVRAYLQVPETLPCGDAVLELRHRPLLMGILNCTPDSFYEGSRTGGASAVERGLTMVQEGADLLDLGGESTRPGSEPITIEEEIERVVPVVEALAAATDVPLSIDTTKAQVAAAALAAGACIVNDVSGFSYDEAMAGVAADAGATVVLMHMRGTPTEMYGNAEYHDVMAEVAAELRSAVARARGAGVAAERIVIDPGIGFAKRAEHSLIVLKNLHCLRSLGCPIMAGPSRKSFIGAVLDLPAEERLEGTGAAVTAAVLGGAQILRVHDVGAMRRVADVAAAIRDEGAGWTR